MLVAIVRNPTSGAAPETVELEHALRAAGVRAEIIDTPSGGLTTEWLDGVAASHDVIAAAGGDGTVSAVAAAAARADKILAVIPTGTLNHFARDLGIPIELEKAIALLGTGRRRAVDAGFVNDHFFLNNVSLGSYPQMVHARTALEQRGRSRRVAGLIAVAKTWWRLRSRTAVITIDGRNLIRRSPFIVVGNGSYVLSGLALSRRDNISDGQLSLYVAPGAGRLGAMSLPFRALLGRLERYEQFETFRGRQISIELSRRRVPAGIDGEVRVLESPLRFAVRPGALRVIVP